MVMKQKSKKGTAMIDYKTKQGAVSAVPLLSYSDLLDATYGINFRDFGVLYKHFVSP